jgi:hypothetical protein
MSPLRPLAAALLLAFAILAPARAAGPLDEGKLDPAWFGAGLEFREAEEIDYLWVKPGFTLEGRKLRFAPWQEPEFRGEDASERDAKDKRLANDLTRDLPEVFAEAFQNGLGSRVPQVESGEEVTAVGRIVDCSTGSTAAKFWVGMGAGSGSTTFDLKFVDAASGELLAALHHRVVSGSNLSTTDSKLVDWVDELADELGEKGLDRLYAKGKRVKE